MVESQQVQHGGVQVVQVHFSSHGAEAEFVGLAMRQAAFHAAARQEGAVAVGLVLAAVLAVACVLALAPSARAQNATPTQKQLNLQAARAERKAMVGENMNLTPKEAKAFWPLYNAYEKKMEQIEDRHIAEVKAYAKSYKNLTDSDAKKKLDSLGLHARTGETRPSSTEPKSTVLAQTPLAGERTARGSDITLDVSAGQRRATIPPIHGPANMPTE